MTTILGHLSYVHLVSDNFAEDSGQYPKKFITHNAFNKKETPIKHIVTELQNYKFFVSVQCFDNVLPMSFKMSE